MLCGIADVARRDGAVPVRSGRVRRRPGAAVAGHDAEHLPAEQRGSAMAIWGMGVMLGPILGPTLGGYLTELYNWRYVFFVNLPFGIAATRRPVAVPAAPRRSSAGCASTGSASACSRSASPGCSSCSTAARPRTGSARPRSSSKAVTGVGGFYLFVVHMITGERRLHQSAHVPGPELPDRRPHDVRRRDGADGDPRRCWRRGCRSWAATRWKWRGC